MTRKRKASETLTTEKTTTAKHDYEEVKADPGPQLAWCVIDEMTAQLLAGPFASELEASLRADDHGLPLVVSSTGDGTCYACQGNVGLIWCEWCELLACPSHSDEDTCANCMAKHVAEVIAEDERDEDHHDEEMREVSNAEMTDSE